MRDTIKKVITEIVGVIEESASLGDTVAEAIETITSILGTPRRAALDDYATAAERLYQVLGTEPTVELVKRYMELESAEKTKVLENLSPVTEAVSSVMAAIFEIRQSGLPRMSDLENAKFARPSDLGSEPVEPPLGPYAIFHTARETARGRLIYHPDSLDFELAKKELSKMALPSRAEAARILWAWMNEMLLVHEGNASPSDSWVATLADDPINRANAFFDEKGVCEHFFAGKIDPPDVPLVAFGDDKRHRQHGIRFEQHGFWFLSASQAVDAGLISACRPDIVVPVPPRAD